MNQRQRTTALATMTIFLIALVLSSAGTTQQASAITVPRGETVWGSGYGQSPASYQPWNTGDNQAVTTYIMYEPLFGTNVATGQIIKWLGQDIAWLNTSCIKITIRQKANWTSCGSGLATNSTPITADDVIYSFMIYQYMGQIGQLMTNATGKGLHGYGRLGGNVSQTFIKDATNNKVLYVWIKNASYKGSTEVYRQLTNSFLIMPKVVWQDINTTLAGALSGFANDWTNISSTVPGKWRVASGMYLPYWHDTKDTIAARNANWWGKGDPSFGRLPNPKYFAYTKYATNDLALLAMERGDLDWCGNYLGGLAILKQQYSRQLVTYFDNLPYYADKCPVYLVPNYARGYPINASWLHKAMSWALDQLSISAASSSYLKAPSPMYIPADDALARTLLNTTIETKYSTPYNVSKAHDILVTYCTLNETTTVWWTKQGVTPSDPVKHYPLAKWPGAPIAMGGDGTNATEPWEILNFNGWSDVNAIDYVAAYGLHFLQWAQDKPLNLVMDLDQGAANQWGVVQTRVNSGDFDWYNHCMAGQINMNMYERYFQIFSPQSAGAGGGVKAPLGGYNNPTLVDLIDDLDNATIAQASANQIQEILGQEMPYVPWAGHADWQTYSNQYWMGWPNEVKNKMLAGSPFYGLTQNANNHMITFNLSVYVAPTTPTTPVSVTTIVSTLPGGGTTTIVSTIGGTTADYTIAIVVVVIIVVAVVAVGAIMLRRKPGK